MISNTLTGMCLRVERDRVFAEATPEQQEHMCAYADPLNTWMRVLPLKHKHYLLSAPLHRRAVRRRLGLSLFPTVHTCVACGKAEMDVQGLHVLCCQSWRSTSKRHNAVQDGLCDASRLAGIAGVQKEVRCGFPGALRPADVYYPQWDE